MPYLIRLYPIMNLNHSIMDRITALIRVLITIIFILIGTSLVLVYKLDTANENNELLKSECVNLEDEIVQLDNELFKMKKERVAGIILYNSSIIKPNLTMQQSHSLDSVMFMLVDSSDIERIVKNYKLEGTIWQN